MSKLTWDASGERLYETGTKNGVIYQQDTDGKYPKGVAWNGLTAVTESPSGAEATDLYADDIKYLSLMSAEDLGMTIEAYTYPDEFAECDGSAFLAQGVSIGQQTRRAFGFAYRSVVGNDILDQGYGYKLHLVYGCKASPSEKGYSTINDSPDAISFSWEINTTPIEIGTIDGVEYKPTAEIVIDSTKCDKDKLKELEDKLYGTEEDDAYLPLPQEVIELFADTDSGNTGNDEP